MTPDQFKQAENLQKQINNHKGIFELLHDASNQPNTACKLHLGKDRFYQIPDRLIEEFKHSVQHSLNKLEAEFNGL